MDFMEKNMAREPRMYPAKNAHHIYVTSVKRKTIMAIMGIRIPR